MIFCLAAIRFPVAARVAVESRSLVEIFPLVGRGSVTGGHVEPPSGLPLRCEDVSSVVAETPAPELIPVAAR
jgi:hypothetical protein